MKKTYIEPKNIVVALKVRDNVMQTGSINGTQGLQGFQKGEEITTGTYDSDARETVSAPDAWEEW